MIKLGRKLLPEELLFFTADLEMMSLFRRNSRVALTMYLSETNQRANYVVLNLLRKALPVSISFQRFNKQLFVSVIFKFKYQVCLIR